MDTLSKQREQMPDILKAVCIIFVITHHNTWSPEEWNAYFFPFWIQMAVPIFMIITGYVGAKSFERNGIASLSKAYELRLLLHKLLRFLVPFGIYFVLVEGALIAMGSGEYYLSQLFHRFIVGGHGAGTYYTPLMLQLVFYFPIIFFLVKRHHFKGVVLCGIINAVYEVLKHEYGMGYDCYRLLVFRYTLIIAFGCYLALDYKKTNWVGSICSMLVGGAFIYYVCYTKPQMRFLDFWTETSFVACFYIMPIVAILLKRVSLHIKPLELIGRASYDVYLAQGAFFTFINGPLEDRIESRVVIWLVSVAFSCLAGVIYYYIESFITKKVTKVTSELLCSHIGVEKRV